jgi:sugar phosphate isomerase/epimerase
MGVHLKDFVYTREREPVDVVIGTGILDLPALVTALGEVGFGGVPIIEYEGDVNNPVPALTECVREIATAWNL